MINRRHFLGTAALASVAATGMSSRLPAAAAPPAPASPSRGGWSPFSERMPRLPVLKPRSEGGVDTYQLDITKARVGLLPGIKTDVLSYGGSFIGPTIRARTGRPVRVTFRNRLTKEANVHLHGGQVRPEHDGYSTDLIAPGASRTYEYPNNQRGTMLWYHDHAMMAEAENVYRGLHGLYVIEDPAEAHLGLPSGEYDVPILIREASFDDRGQLHFALTDFNRPTVLVNGKNLPHFPVDRRRYRLRIVNGSTHGWFTLGLDRGEFTVIGTDGGLLPAPVPSSELRLSPGERADVVVDFARWDAGQHVVLSDARGPVLRFDVGRTVRDDSRVPDRLRELPAPGNPTNERSFTLTTDFQHIASLINGKSFDPNRIDARIPLGSTEVWKVVNGDHQGSDPFMHVDHNFHLHLVQFRILSREGRPLGAWERGLKDTVGILPGESVRLQATFAPYTGRYLFHCHILEHSQVGMMGNMEIVR
jgi:FtsP/CotA-like multicopper oxidase with cupredoxin domain